MVEFTPQDTRYAKLVDRYSRHIKSPVQRLKFLNAAMRMGRPKGAAGRLPFMQSLHERAWLVVEISKLLPPDEPAPLAFRVTSLLYRMRYALYAVCLMAMLGAGAGAVYVVGRVVGSLSVPTQAGEAHAAPVSAAANGEAVAAIASEAGLPLDKVWLAERGEGFEFYSNGARVLTEYETEGEPRSFYRFDIEGLAEGAARAEMGDAPVGIIYHASEGDLLPFAGRYNASLQRRSKSLLEYAREKRLYNYVIDRFGRIYRIVRDEQAANHAGHSIWSDGRRVYVNLNASFIGVCFEGKLESGREVGPDSINEAQIYAARVLTAVLRSKYQIADANCVTHGLVSVSPASRLLGYHTDWVGGFPFEAVGLTDKYEAEMVAVSRLGFAYDRAYLKAAGGQAWPGLARAEAAVRAAAAERGTSPAEQRAALYEIYQKLYAEQRALARQDAAGGEASGE